MLTILIFLTLNLLPKKNLFLKNKTKKQNKKTKNIVLKLKRHKIIPTHVFKNNVTLKYTKSLLVLNENTAFSIKSLFHFKHLWSLKEFQFYDLLNFYKNTSKKFNYHANNVNLQPDATLITKINYFYNVRYSVKISRYNFSHVNNYSFKTNKQLNKALLKFFGLSCWGYIWLYDFNASVFLIKTGVSSNLNFSRKLVNLNMIFLNNNVINNPRQIIQPTNTFQIVLSQFMLLMYKNHVFRLFYFFLFFKKYMKFFYKKIFNKKNFFFQKKIKSLSFFKIKHLKFLETDYKTLTFILLPFKNNSIYYKYVYLVWLNYWNYRTLLWKHIT